MFITGYDPTIEDSYTKEWIHPGILGPLNQSGPRFHTRNQGPGKFRLELKQK